MKSNDKKYKDGIEHITKEIASQDKEEFDGMTTE